MRRRRHPGDPPPPVGPRPERGGAAGAGNDEVEEQILVHGSPSAVWSALVDDDRRRRWWPHLDLDAVPGGRFLERWTKGDGVEVVTSGAVVDVTPNRLLRLTWSDEDWPAETEVVITLAPMELGTVVMVRHSGWGRLADGYRLAEEHRAGWRAHLSSLRAHVEG